MASTKTTDVVAQRALPDDMLSSISSFEDAAELLNAQGIAVENFDDYGTGFEVLPTKDKTQLVGAPFVILEWRFTDGDNGEFVSALCVTKDGRKLVLNDGSTGIRDQLRSVERSRTAAKHRTPTQGLMVPRGLTRSDYTYYDSNGKQSPATTYYLSN